MKNCCLVTNIQTENRAVNTKFEWMDEVIVKQTGKYALVLVAEPKDVNGIYRRYLDLYAKTYLDDMMTFLNEDSHFASVLFKDETHGGVFIIESKFKNLVAKDIWSTDWLEITVDPITNTVTITESAKSTTENSKPENEGL